jgi:ribonuclease D
MPFRRGRVLKQTEPRGDTVHSSHRKRGSQARSSFHQYPNAHGDEREARDVSNHLLGHESEQGTAESDTQCGGADQRCARREEHRPECATFRRGRHGRELSLIAQLSDEHSGEGGPKEGFVHGAPLKQSRGYFHPLRHTRAMSVDRFDLPVTYVDSPDLLAEALPLWHSADLLAVDIECSLTGMHHCVLALLQVATHEQAWLVDPIPLADLMKPTLQAMAEVPWIVHDFSGDGVVFKRLYDVVPNSVMDTMLLARALGYPQPGLKTLAKLKLGVNIPKEEQDSNWMLRPLRDTQLSYAARDATLLLPLLRRLADEADANKDHPEIGPRLARLPMEMRGLFRRVRQYQKPKDDPVIDKVAGLGIRAVEQARQLTQLRAQWGNEGDVGAVMEMGNRWILARIEHPPSSREQLERSIPNPRFRRKRLDALWNIFHHDAPCAEGDEDDLLAKI